jgi:hypothetical protein
MRNNSMGARPGGKQADPARVRTATRLAHAESENALGESSAGLSRPQRALRTLTATRQAPSAREEVVRAVAEIERASKALQSLEPLSGPRPSGLYASTQAGQHRSIWLMLAIIWIATTVVLVIGTAAILYLVR